MACLLKAPNGSFKGCVVFTTQERDHVIAPDPATRAQIEALKQRYVVGLHHNWHDYQFRYDPLFDFSLAGDGDLIEASGKDFPRIPMDACNFAPGCYSLPRSAPFWDILYVARAVNFKGIPEFFQTIRALYDGGRKPRVLFICAIPPRVEIPGIADLRAHFESLFSLGERKRVTFLSLDWDYPFPFDADTLAYFYRNSRIFFHTAPEERRCRTAAYAWAGGMTVVANRNVASILPAQFHRPPFLFAFDDPAQLPAALAAALDNTASDDEAWREVAAEFSAEASAIRLSALLDGFAQTSGWGRLAPGTINCSKLDIRLGRHLDLPSGINRVDMKISNFCDALRDSDDATVRRICETNDPEESLCEITGRRTLPSNVARTKAAPIDLAPHGGRGSPISAALRKMGLIRS